MLPIGHVLVAGLLVPSVPDAVRLVAIRPRGYLFRTQASSELGEPVGRCYLLVSSGTEPWGVVTLGWRTCAPGVLPFLLLVLPL
eukprot:1223300-Heterocapsa_arctica.AAC.2